ncbi:glycosyltransferase [Mastigocoleus sp. MO_188.B34]|uniref:glycosyltransferase n=1 Tax=Mastigocoleus sp. MO_188.B34 TaxID=3036635 RepID=UPI0026246A8E|nr:glycosyltransferase [Mastigocoleus sp. MO_188.B34]
MSDKCQTSFVCCVESGALENYTLRMIESLRKWGGKFADAPIYAVTPRFGPPLSQHTKNTFARLNVNHIRCNPRTNYSWLGFLNKPLALVAAEERITSESVCWLDSDILILGEPEELILKEGEDFVACASDKNIGSVGLEDPQDKFWKEVYTIFDLNIENIPWIVTEREKKNIRIYWNSGVFAYRRSLGFAKDYLQVCLDILDAGIANHESSIFFHEQVALVLAMLKRNLKWRALPYSYNYGMGSKTHSQWYSEEQLKATKIVHYHDAMWPWFWETFVDCLNKTYPPVAQWLKPLGPLKNEAPIQWRATSKLLKEVRTRQLNNYKKTCKVL